MSRFKCILCFKSSASKPIPLTKRINDFLTLQDCITHQIPKIAETISNNERDSHPICSKCFTKFVSFYEFLSIINNNYGWSQQIKIEKEVNSFENLNEATKISRQDVIYQANRPITRNCSVVLERLSLKGNFVKFDQIIKTEVIEPSEEVAEESRREDSDSDSDFEWPASDGDFNDWTLPETINTAEDEVEDVKMMKDEKKVQFATPKFIKKPSKRPIDDPTDEDFNLNISKKVCLLPLHLQTPEILNSGQTNLTMKRITYKVPKKRVTKTSKKNEKFIISEKPRGRQDTQGEKLIADNINIKCHLGCDIKLENFFSLGKHFKKSHPDEKPYLNCFCGSKKKFYRRRLLIEHLEWHNGKIIQCPQCNKNFKSRNNLNQHIITHHSMQKRSNDFMCEECGKVFKSTIALSYHIKSHLPGSFECFICHIPKATFYSLKHHLNTKHNMNPSTEKQIICHICSKMFNANYLKRHMDMVHTKNHIERIPCQFCDRWLLPWSFKTHMKMHQGENSESVECEICHKILSRKGTLANHMNRVHSDKSKNKFECTFCDKKFFVELKLKEHIAVVHTRQFLFHCRVCGCGFRAKTNWTRHEKIEHPEEYEKRFKPNWLRSTNDPAREEEPIIEPFDDPAEVEIKKPFQCNLCQKCYPTEENLRMHIKRVHSERNFGCDECGKTFYRSVKLKEHIAVNHTREFPWSCEICGKGFRIESGWYYHKKMAHPDHIREKRK